MYQIKSEREEKERLKKEITEKETRKQLAEWKLRGVRRKERETGRGMIEMGYKKN